MGNRRVTVHRLTRNGYEKKPDDGGLPPELKNQMSRYKFRAQGGAGRCARYGFMPFRQASGKLYTNAVSDGVPRPTSRTPLHLVTATEKSGGAREKLVGHMLLHPARNDPSTLKLQYMCKAQGASGMGDLLLAQLRPKTFRHNRYSKVQLDNNSGIPGFYAKRGFRVATNSRGVARHMSLMGFMPAGNDNASSSSSSSRKSTRPLMSRSMRRLSSRGMRRLKRSVAPAVRRLMSSRRAPVYERSMRPERWARSRVVTRAEAARMRGRRGGV